MDGERPGGLEEHQPQDAGGKGQLLLYGQGRRIPGVRRGRPDSCVRGPGEEGVAQVRAPRRGRRFTTRLDPGTRHLLEFRLHEGGIVEE